MTIPAVFTDFYLAQDPTYVNNPNKLKEAVSYRTTVLRRLLAHKDGHRMLGGGEDIRSRIQLDDQGDAHFWSVDTTESPSQPQVVSEIVSHWAFARVSTVWDDPTLALNNSRLSDKERRIAIFNLKAELDQKAIIEKGKFIERSLWATPVVAMETSVPGGPMYSIPVFINELPNTLPTGFTVVETINPVTKLNWQNQVASYTGDTAEEANSDLLFALSRMSRLVHYEGLPLKPEFGNRDTMPAAVYTSINGITLLEHAMRATQDAFVWLGRQDPGYAKPTIHGIPIEWIDYIRTAAIFPTGASGAYSTEVDTTNAGTTNMAGPRFFFTNLEDLNMFFHREWFMHKHSPQTWPGQPTRKVVYQDTFLNLICENRRTQGIVFPTTTDVDAAFRT